MAQETVLQRFVTEYVFRKDTRQLDDLDRRVKRTQEVIGKFGRGLMAGGAGLTAGLFSVGKAVMDFETNMNAVAAASGVTGRDFDRLRNQALDLGRTTAFSAGQAAEAQKFLAQAGFDTNEIIAAMPHVLDLAAAGQMDLAQAAQTMTSSLAGFNLEATDSQRVVDVFAKAASSAKTNIFDMGRSLVYAAPIATELGISIESVSAASATLQNKGMRTEMAGTALKTMFSRLIAIAGPAAAALEEIGIAAPDIQALMKEGKWKEALSMLKTAGMDIETAQKVFGMEGFNAVVMLSKELGNIEEFEKMLYGSEGTGKRMADRMLQGLPGAIKILQSQIEGFKIALGDAGVTAAIIGFAKVIGDVVEWIQELDPVFQTMIAGLVSGGPIIIGIGAALQAVSWAITPLLPLFGFLTKAIMALSAVIIANPIGAAIAVIVGALFLLWKYWDEWIAFWRSSFEKVQMWLMDNDLFVPIAEGIQFIKDAWLAFIDLLFGTGKRVKDFFTGLLPVWLTGAADISTNENEAGSISRSPLQVDRTAPDSDGTGISTGDGPSPVSRSPLQSIRNLPSPGLPEPDISVLAGSQAQARIPAGGGVPGSEISKTSNTNVDIGEININAPGADSKEIAQNINRQIRYQTQGVAEDQNSIVAK